MWKAHARDTAAVLVGLAEIWCVRLLTREAPTPHTLHPKAAARGQISGHVCRSTARSRDTQALRKVADVGGTCRQSRAL